MSYSKAWTIIKRTEKALNYSLIETKVGGVDGGGSYLTPNAKDLLENYKDFNREGREAVNKIFKKYF